MTGPGEEKLRVLVVDDDPGFISDIEKQSLAYPDSKLLIESRESFDKGIEYFSENQTPDLVVVDYKLGGGHTAKEFIQKAKQLGIVVPFAIVTGMEPAFFTGANTLDGILGSNDADIFVKKDLTSFWGFQLRLLDLYVRFRRHAILLEELLVLTSEARDLNRLISSYKKQVRPKSFHRLCDLNDSTIERLSTNVQQALFASDEQSLSVDNATARQELAASPYQKLSIADAVPFAKDHAVSVKKIVRVTTLLTSAKKDSSEINALVGQLLDIEKSSGRFAEYVLVRCAKTLASKKRANDGLEILYQFSLCLASRNEKKRLVGADLITAAYLRNVGNAELAERYARAAEDRARLLGDTRLCDIAALERER